MITSSACYFCSNFQEIENFELAKADKTRVWEIHHKLEEFYSLQELKDQNKYYNRPANELVFVLKTGNGDSTHHFWWPHVSRKGLPSSKGKRWWTNGVVNTRSIDCPGEGWYLGRTYDPETLENVRKLCREKHYPKGIQKRSEESKEKMRQAQLNMKRHWYTNGQINKPIKEGDEIPEGFYLGRTISDESKQRESTTKLSKTGGLY